MWFFFWCFELPKKIILQVVNKTEMISYARWIDSYFNISMQNEIRDNFCITKYSIFIDNKRSLCSCKITSTFRFDFLRNKWLQFVLKYYYTWIDGKVEGFSITKILKLLVYCVDVFCNQNSSGFFSKYDFHLLFKSMPYACLIFKIDLYASVCRNADVVYCFIYNYKLQLILFETI